MINKILIWSVNPHVSSGYGEITDRLIDIFKSLNKEVVIQSSYGCNFITYHKNCKIYPNVATNKYGNDTIAFVNKIEQPDLILSTFDLFALDVDVIQSLKKSTKIASLLMVDSEPYQTVNYMPLSIIDYPICVTEWAKHQIPTKIRSDMHYIPLPLSQDYFNIDKQTARAKMNKLLGSNITDEELVCVISANAGDAQNRKNYWGIINGWKKYIQKNGTNNKKLYLHTDVRGNLGNGIDIKMALSFAQYTKEELNTIMFPPQMKYYMHSYTTKDLNNIYNSSDLYLNPCHSEGFGMPLVEAMACGVQPLVTNFGATKELVQKCTDSKYCLLDGMPQYIGHQGIRCMVQPDTIANGIEQALNNKKNYKECYDMMFNAKRLCGFNSQKEQWSKFLKEIQ